MHFTVFKQSKNYLQFCSRNLFYKILSETTFLVSSVRWMLCEFTLKKEWNSLFCALCIDAFSTLPFLLVRMYHVGLSLSLRLSLSQDIFCVSGYVLCLGLFLSFYCTCITVRVNEILLCRCMFYWTCNENTTVRLYGHCTVDNTVWYLEILKPFYIMWFCCFLVKKRKC